LILSRVQKAIVLQAIKTPGIYQRDAYRILLRNHSEYYLWNQVQKLSSADYLRLEKVKNRVRISAGPKAYIEAGLEPLGVVV
jgi:hypothetical protein